METQEPTQGDSSFVSLGPSLRDSRSHVYGAEYALQEGLGACYAILDRKFTSLPHNMQHNPLRRSPPLDVDPNVMNSGAEN